MEDNSVENKNLVKILIGIIIALVLVIGFIIISFIFAYLISKIKVGKKSLLIPPLVIVTIKVVILFCILK